MKRTKVVAALAGLSVGALLVAGCSSSGSATSDAAGGSGAPSESSQSSTESSSAEPSTESSSAGPSTGESETSGSAMTSSEAESSGAGASSGSAGAAPSIPAPTSASKNYNVAFIQGVIGDNFYITMKCGIQAQAKKLGVTVKTQGPKQFDPSLQKPILDSVVQSKPDAILIAPDDAKAMQAPLAAAAKSGIKVVLVDTTTEDPSFAVSQVASDNIGGGKAAFKAIKQLSPDGGDVLIISVNPGITTTDQRTKGFKEAAQADSDFKYVGVQYSHDDPTKAAQLVTAALQKDPNIVGIFGANLFSAEGAATGVRQAGMKGKVKIVGFDAGPTQVKDLKKGTVQALVAQQPSTIGKDGLNQAVQALDGGTVTSKIQTGFSIITKDNVDQSDALYKAKC